MTIPLTAPVAEDSMDPRDTVDYVIDLAALLEEGETFAAIDFAVMAQSVLLGFTILDAAPHAPEQIADAQVKIWVTVDLALQANPAWSGKGAACGVEFTATTDAARTYQRTVAIQVVQK